MRSLLLVLALAVFPAAASADARVARVSGPVTVKALGHSGFVSVDAGARLFSGDTLRTGPGGVAHVELDDGAVLLVAGGSTVVLSGEPDDPMLEVRLGEWVLGVAGKLVQGARVRATTPQAVAAIHGGLFWGKTDPRETQVAAVEGVVTVTAGRKTVRVRAGELAHVPAGAAPEKSRRQPVARSLLERFAIGGSLAGLEALAPKK